MKDLGERIKEYRTSMKMTQADVYKRQSVQRPPSYTRDQSAEEKDWEANSTPAASK